MNLDYTQISLIVAILIGVIGLVKTFNYWWELDEVKAEKVDRIAKLQSEIIQKLLIEQKGEQK